MRAVAARLGAVARGDLDRGHVAMAKALMGANWMAMGIDLSGCVSHDPWI